MYFWPKKRVLASLAGLRAPCSMIKYHIFVISNEEQKKSPSHSYPVDPLSIFPLPAAFISQIAVVLLSYKQLKKIIALSV